MLIFFVVIISVLIGFCGLALDTGLLEVKTLQLQMAADVGALAGANEIAHNDPNNFINAEKSDLTTYESLNGLPNMAPTNAGTVGTWLNDYSTVTVSLQQTFPTIFMGVLNSASSNFTLNTTAVATFPPCMFFLGTPNLNMGFNSLNTQAYEVASAGVDGPLGCPVYSRTGISIDYFAHLHGMQVKVSGLAGGSYATGNFSVPVIYNAPVMGDPLAYLTAPTAGACLNATPLSYTASVTLTPGTYCGKTTGSTTTPALSVSGPSCSTTPVVTFSPGLYIFAGGLYFNCVSVQGAGVTMYFTNKPSIGYGQFAVYSSTWNLSAPTDSSLGGLPGITLFNNRNWSGGTNQDFIIMFSTWVADGVIYANNTGIYDYNTSMSAPNYLNIVTANMYTYASEVRPSINYASLPGGNPLHTTVTLIQ